MRPLLALCVLAAAALTSHAQSVTGELTRPDLSGEMPVASDESVYYVSATDSTELLERPDLGERIYATPINLSLAPRVFKGYRHLQSPLKYTSFPDPEILAAVWRDSVHYVVSPKLEALADSIAPNPLLPDSLMPVFMFDESSEIPGREDLPVAFGSSTPDWLRRALDTYRFQEDFVYSLMVSDPSYIEYAYWDLPVPPRMPQEDYSFIGFLRRLDLPDAPKTDPLPVNSKGTPINWLHVFNFGLQLSQAYVSSNWYQGGNSYLAFLTNFMWDVQLNQVYYPNVIFQSTVSYKLAINSSPDDEYHKYSVSQDLFQYNLKAGYKAVHNWFYSLNLQFKTPLIHSYPANSETRTAAFLSPGELNVGAGMTYSKENKAKTLKFSASISPISYNLKTCIDHKVDPVQFGIKAGKRVLNEYGSNAEINFVAKFWGSATYTTRLFLFTDYKTFQSDWENTLNFQFSRVFSTQIYAHLRYDSSYDSSISRKWKKLMLTEILSVGISYTFSTK